MGTPADTEILELQSSEAWSLEDSKHRSAACPADGSPVEMPEISPEVAAFLEIHPEVKEYLPGAIAAVERWFPGAELRFELEKSELNGEAASLLVICESPYDLADSLAARRELLRDFWNPLPPDVWLALHFHLDFQGESDN